MTRPSALMRAPTDASGATGGAGSERNENRSPSITWTISSAGGVGAQVFTREAVTLIHERSKGIPRTISVIADNALLTAAAVVQRIGDYRPAPRFHEPELLLDGVRYADEVVLARRRCPATAFCSRMKPRVSSSSSCACAEAPGSAG